MDDDGSGPMKQSAFTKGWTPIVPKSLYVRYRLRPYREMIWPTVLLMFSAIGSITTIACLVFGHARLGIWFLIATLAVLGGLLAQALAR